MEVQKEREAFEKLWLQGNGHFKYFKFSAENGKYISTGVRDNLTNQDLLFASITINTAYLFFLGGTKKAQAVPEWVDVNLKEPPLNTMVLICWSDAPDIEPEKDFMDHDVDHGVNFWANYNDGDEPSHWMLLPKPAAQEQS